MDVENCTYKSAHPISWKGASIIPYHFLNPNNVHINFLEKVTSL